MYFHKYYLLYNNTKTVKIQDGNFTLKVFTKREEIGILSVIKNLEGLPWGRVLLKNLPV